MNNFSNHLSVFIGGLHQRADRLERLIEMWEEAHDLAKTLTNRL